MESWFLLQSPAAEAAVNMAVDAALLRTAPERGLPLLRLYSWRRPAVSIGYFQKYPAELADHYDIVRRPTGGGIVYHDADTTYTVVAPPEHRLYKMTTSEAYCAIHRAVAAALEDDLAVCRRVPPAGSRPGDLSTQSRRRDAATKVLLQDRPPSSPRGTYECFQNPVAGDVVTGARKLAGGAQRRNRSGVLHQGSIAARVSADRLMAGFQREFAAVFTPVELTDFELQLAGQLAREKFATEAWTQHS